MQPKRGKIHSRERAKQLIDFSGLLYGNITPTDIDGLIEYHDKGYILIETKLSGNTFDLGQRLALERLTDDLNKIHKLTICIVADHEVYDPFEDIDIAITTVREYRWKDKWIIPKHVCTTKQMVDYFINTIIDGVDNAKTE